MSLKDEPTVHVLNIKFYAICNDHNNIPKNGYACVSNDNLTKYQYAISPTSVKLIKTADLLRSLAVDISSKQI